VRCRRSGKNSFKEKKIKVKKIVVFVGKSSRLIANIEVIVTQNQSK